MTIELQETILMPKGFRAAGVACGIKKDDGTKDLALFVSDVPDTVAAGMFTTNQVRAASVKLDVERIKSGHAQAIIVNSGNANACNGAAGMTAALATAKAVADLLSLAEEQVLVSSTGSIGVPLPMEKLLGGLDPLVAACRQEGGYDAADAMITTDDAPKYASASFDVDGQTVTLTGLAKGAGMIEPNMATMLAYILTDVAVSSADLSAALKIAVDQSFNRITVDGDTSTNDSVIALANGAAGHTPLTPGHPSWPPFQQSLNDLVLNLAMKIVTDGEGATRVVTLRVTGAASDADADIACRTIANSLLVKTAWAGTYPAWGRIMDALGYSKAKVIEERVNISYNGLPAVTNGVAADTPQDQLSEITGQPAYEVVIDLGCGDGAAVVYSSDCNEAYVRFNMY